jgi:hypothetical protein
MIDLLELALSAHGGLSHWQHLNDANAVMSTTGSLWAKNQRFDDLGRLAVAAATHDQHVIIKPFPATSCHAFFEPEYVSIETTGDIVLDHRESPRAGFAKRGNDEKWDDLDVAYFLGYLLWTYLTTPFLYASPGFLSKEISPCSENGETCRRLKVDFPADFAAHSRSQIAYFGNDGLIRRLDYSIDVLGGMPCVDYASGYREFNGVMLPTGHEVRSRLPNGTDDEVLLSVQIDAASYF